MPEMQQAGWARGEATNDLGRGMHRASLRCLGALLSTCGGAATWRVLAISDAA